MDFFLLYSAKAATKNRAGIFRLSVAAALGACFAVLFPLLSLPSWAAVLIKLAAGAALCAAAGKFSGAKGYFKFTAVFLALSFALGGALLGIFSLAGISFEEGNQYTISSVPVGIPLFCTLVLALCIKAAARKMISSHAKTAVECRIALGQSSVSVAGFYDSGNRVYYMGSPVSVVPRGVAEKLVDLKSIKTFANVHTVAGSKKIAIFTADSLEINDGKDIKVLKDVKLGVSPNAINRAVLHADLAEDN